jgi:antitoxin ParD1/3/4
MVGAARRTFELSEDQASYVDERVASGAFASPDDVVSAGLAALRDRDERLDDWLRDEVAPVVDAMRADPRMAIPIDDVAAVLRRDHEERLASRS